MEDPTRRGFFSLLCQEVPLSCSLLIISGKQALASGVLFPQLDHLSPSICLSPSCRIFIHFRNLLNDYGIHSLKIISMEDRLYRRSKEWFHELLIEIFSLCRMNPWIFNLTDAIGEEDARVPYWMFLPVMWFLASSAECATSNANHQSWLKNKAIFGRQLPPWLTITKEVFFSRRKLLLDLDNLTL